MTMNMNVKGRQTKLLAAIAVFAMVACVFAVVMPSEDVSGTTVTNDTQTNVVEWTSDIEAISANSSYYIAADVATETNPALTSESLRATATPANTMAMTMTAARSFTPFVLFTFAFIGAYDERFLNTLNSF